MKPTDNKFCFILFFSPKWTLNHFTFQQPKVKPMVRLSTEQLTSTRNSNSVEGEKATATLVDVPFLFAATYWKKKVLYYYHASVSRK